MDKTPRTDELDLEILDGGIERYEAYRAMREFARTLERELSAKNERDLKPPEKKRWFCLVESGRAFSPDDAHEIWNADGLVSCGMAIEVQESDLTYLEKPEGDWALRIPERGDECLLYPYKTETAIAGDYIDRLTLHGYRWCKPSRAECPENERDDRPSRT